MLNIGDEVAVKLDRESLVGRTQIDRISKNFIGKVLNGKIKYIYANKERYGIEFEENIYPIDTILHFGAHAHNSWGRSKKNGFNAYVHAKFVHKVITIPSLKIGEEFKGPHMEDPYTKAAELLKTDRTTAKSILFGAGCGHKGSINQLSSRFNPDWWRANAMAYLNAAPQNNFINLKDVDRIYQSFMNPISFIKPKLEPFGDEELLLCP